MVTFRQNFKNNLSFLAEKLFPFFYGPFYPAILSLITVFIYTANLTVLGLYIFVFFACVTLILYSDFTPFMPLPMMVMMLIRNLNIFLSFSTYIPLIFAVFALIFHFIVYPVKIKSGKLYLPIILITIALFTGGFFAPYLNRYHMGLASKIATGPVIFLVYILFYNYCNPPKNFDLAKYVSYILVLIGLVTTAQILIYKYFFFSILEEKVLTHIGWNNVNGVASLLIFIIPTAFFLLIKTKKVFSLSLTIILLYIGVYTTKSDACIGISMVTLPLLIVYTYLKADFKTKRIFSYLCYIFLIISIIIFAFILDKLDFSNILDFSDNGRIELFNEGWQLFLQYPFFGVGIGYAPPDATGVNALLAYNFHSTFFHVVATMGIVGLITFTYYFIARYQVLTKKNTAFNLFSFMAFTFMEAYGFVDTCEFNIMPLIFVVTFLLIVVELENQKEREILPLKNEIL